MWAGVVKAAQESSRRRWTVDKRMLCWRTLKPFFSNQFMCKAHCALQTFRNNPKALVCPCVWQSGNDFASSSNFPFCFGWIWLIFLNQKSLTSFKGKQKKRSPPDNFWTRRPEESVSIWDFQSTVSIQTQAHWWKTFSENILFLISCQILSFCSFWRPMVLA